ncbi:MAG: Flp pilus assembly protein CpaB [bacterium]
MKSKLPLIAAIVVAIAAVMIIRVYLQSVDARVAAQNKGKRFAAAKIDIKAGAVLEPSVLKSKEVPDRFKPARAIEATDDNFKTVVGQKTALPIKADQVIQWTDLDSGRPGGFESVIPMGERAFTTKMAGGIKGGLVQPGDHVDILVNFAIPETKGAKPSEKPEVTWRSKSEIVNIVLLQNVTVLSVGDSFMADSKAPRTANDMTLAVTIPEAQILMFAAQHGDLAAVLRRREDGQSFARPDLPRVTFETLEALVGDLESQRKKRTIEILKGGAIEHVTVEDKPVNNAK